MQEQHLETNKKTAANKPSIRKVIALNIIFILSTAVVSGGIVYFGHQYKYRYLREAASMPIPIPAINAPRQTATDSEDEVPEPLPDPLSVTLPNFDEFIWDEPMANFTLQKVMLGDFRKILSPTAKKRDGSSVARGEVFHALVLVFKITTNDSVQKGNCVPVDLRLTNQDGDLYLPLSSGHISPSGYCNRDPNTTYTNVELYFEAEKPETEFLIYTGDYSKRTFMFSFSDPNSVQVKQVDL